MKQIQAFAITIVAKHPRAFPQATQGQLLGTADTEEDAEGIISSQLSIEQQKEVQVVRLVGMVSTESALLNVH
jgi:hypothetical protein